MYRKIAGITYFPAFIGFFLMNLQTCNISNNDHSEDVQKVLTSSYNIQKFVYITNV